MNTLSVLFQPIKKMGNAVINWAECLIGHDEYSAFDVIQALEKSGSEHELDHYMLLKTLESIENGGMADVDVFINICRKTPEDPEFIMGFANTINASKYSKRIVVEINENTDFTSDNVHRSLMILREQGIRIALDDFRSGSISESDSGLNSFDIIKVDISELRKCNTAVKSEDTVYSRLKHNGHYVIAEGVETEQQLDWLIKQGVDAVQGYHIGKKCTRECFISKFVYYNNIAN